MKLILGVGETKTVNLQGGRFYFENGLYRINCKMIGGGDAREFKLYAGQGFVCKEGDRFSSLEITNLGEVQQDIEFEVSDREVYDNRARIVGSGDVLPVDVANTTPIDVRLNYSVQRAIDKKVVTGGVATKILNSDLTRMKAALHFIGDCYMGISNTVTAANGFPISSGSDWVDENTAELWVFSVAGCTVHILEDRR